MRKIWLTAGLLLVLGLTPLAPSAQAWGGVRIGIGLPIYVGPGPYYYGYPYRYYYPPTYVVPAPQVIIQAPPTATAPAPPPPAVVSSEAVAAPTTPSYAAAPAPLPRVTNVVPVSGQTSPQIDALVRQLAQTNETARRDAALQLGRMKANRAADALANVMMKDSSPMVRDSAARALGLIGSPTSLKALIYSAQADDDREVRHSAQFAVEAIRSNLRGN